MADTQQEEAGRCPWCLEPGAFIRTTPARESGRDGIKRGTKLDLYECKNERCENVGERWVIQINPDGTIPPKGIRDQQDKHWDINRHTSPQERQRARDALARMYQQQLGN